MAKSLKVLIKMLKDIGEEIDHKRQVLDDEVFPSKQVSLAQEITKLVEEYEKIKRAINHLGE